MPTVQQILDDIKSRLPYSTVSFPDSRVIDWMNQCQNEVWRYMASTELYEFNTIASQALYNLPSNCAFDMIKSVQVSNSTIIDGTEGYTTYSYVGPDDELSGNKYYDALGQVGIYPKPSTSGTGYSVKITYEASPTQLGTGTLNIVPSINAEYQDILKFRAMKNIAQSGNAPDVELANNYQREEDSLFNKIKMDYYKRKQRIPRSTWSYKSGWWKG